MPAKRRTDKNQERSTAKQMTARPEKRVKRTVDETILFLVKNATPDPFLPVDLKSEVGVRPLADLLLRLCGTTRYTVPLEAFEAFVGEPFSFEKHLRAVHEEGTISFGVPKPGDFYDSASYRKAFDESNGCVGEGDRSWLAFHIRATRDDFLPMYHEVCKNAEELGLVLEPYPDET